MRKEKFPHFFLKPLILAIFLNLFLSLPASQAADVTLFDGLGTGCASTYTGGYLESNRYIAKSNTSITTISYLFGNQSTTNFSSSYLYIYSDDSTYNAPSARLATFSPTVISGSGTLTIGKYTGNYSISQGTKFWIVPSLNASSLPWCYWNTSVTSFLNGVISVDTSTSNSNAVYPKVYKAGTVIPASSGWDYAGNIGQLWQLSIQSSSSTPIAASLSISGNPSNIVYRTTTTLSVNVDAVSKVTFYASNKRIPNCINLRSDPGLVSCNWKPSTKGAISITAKVKSLDNSYVDSESNVLTLLVKPRSNTR